MENVTEKDQKVAIGVKIYDEYKAALGNFPIQVTGNTFLLEEMLDSMNKSIENAKKIREQQVLLIRVVEEHASDELEEFIGETKKIQQNLDEQILKLSKRANLVKYAIEAIQEDSQITKVITVLLEGLGVFEGC